MKRVLLIAAALASLAFVAAPSPSQAATSVGFSIRIGDPYRGAAIRFRSEPDYVVVPGTRIYYIEDYYGRDIYRYGGWFYMVDEDGFWYRARSLRGPFFAIDVDILPDVFYDVPAGYYHYWSPARLSGSYYWRSGDRIYYRGGNYRTRDRYYGDRDRYYGGGDRYYSRDRNYSGDRNYQRSGDYRTRTRDNWDWNRTQENRVQQQQQQQQQDRVQQNNNPPPQDNRGDRGNRGNWRGRGRGQDNRDQGDNGNGNGRGNGHGRGRGNDNGND